MHVSTIPLVRSTVSGIPSGGTTTSVWNKCEYCGFARVDSISVSFLSLFFIHPLRFSVLLRCRAMTDGRITDTEARTIVEAVRQER